MIRPASRDDLSAVLRLLAQMHPNDPVVPAIATSEVFDQIAASPWLHLLVFEVEAAIVGTIYLNLIPNLTRGGRPYGVIENVIVDETHRGRGHGKEMMAATLARAWDEDCYKVMLMTGSKNPATHGFYRASGFSADAKTGYLARPNS